MMKLNLECIHSNTRRGEWGVTRSQYQTLTTKSNTSRVFFFSFSILIDRRSTFSNVREFRHDPLLDLMSQNNLWQRFSSSRLHFGILVLTSIFVIQLSRQFVLIILCVSDFKPNSEMVLNQTEVVAQSKQRGFCLRNRGGKID